MCSIGGFIFKDFYNLEEKKQAILRLLKEMEERGSDATGISMINTSENKIKILKFPIPAEFFVENEEVLKFISDNLKNSNLVLLHTRAATSGDKTNNVNNHPIYDKEFNSVLIHNGIIRNYKELKEKYKIATDGEVDSEIILDIFHLTNGNMNKLYTLLEGSFSFALYHNRSLKLVRYSNPLTIAFIKELNSICFCSKLEIMKEAFSEMEVYEHLFVEKVLKYRIVPLTLKDSSLIEINFSEQGIKYDILDKNLYLIQQPVKKEKKKNKGKLEKEVETEIQKKGYGTISYTRYDYDDDEYDELPFEREYNSGEIYCKDCGYPIEHCACAKYFFG